jgi:hypothetical protein
MTETILSITSLLWKNMKKEEAKDHSNGGCLSFFGRNGRYLLNQNTKALLVVLP